MTMVERSSISALKKKSFQITERFLRQSRSRIYGHPVNVRVVFTNSRTFEIFAESRGFSMKHAAYLFAN